MNEQAMTQSSVTIKSSSGVLGKLKPALFAVLLGGVVIAAIGFAPGMAHNAAHDTRHVMVFPCH